MHLDAFELHRPESLSETLRLAQTWAGQSDFLAGGTDLLPNYKMHLNLRPHLIALDRVSELGGVSLDRFGATATLGELERYLGQARAYPGVADAVTEVATPLVRATATLGGNLLVDTRCFFFNQSHFWRQSLGYCLKADGDRCHVVPQKERCYATFSGDLAPALMVVDAEVEVAGASGVRRLPLRDLYDRTGDGIRRLRLAPGELLVAVHLPSEARQFRASYLKLRIRPSFDFPELGVAVAARTDGDRIEALRLAVGGLETYPRRFDELTDPLEGQRWSEERIRDLAAAVSAAVRPVRNTSLAPDYRKRMAGVYVRRAIDRMRHRGG